MATKVWQMPKVGDLLSCKFPYEVAAEADDKFRPCLVSHVLQRRSTNEVWLVVVPGTGQQTSDQVRNAALDPLGYEEPADPSHATGTNLREATIFEFALRARIKYDSERFSEGDRNTPVFGHASNELTQWLSDMKIQDPEQIPLAPPPPAPIQVEYKRSAASLKRDWEARERDADSDADG